MKKLKIFLIAFITLFVLALMQPVNAQTSITKEKVGNDGLKISVASTLIDSVTTVYSQWFTLGDFNQDATTANLGNYTKLLTSATGIPRVTTTLQGSNDQTNIFTLDSLGIVADSIETAQKGTFDFNSIANSNRFNYYRFKDVGEASNRSDTYIKKEIYITK